MNSESQQDCHSSNTKNQNCRPQNHLQPKAQLIGKHIIPQPHKKHNTRSADYAKPTQKANKIRLPFADPTIRKRTSDMDLYVIKKSSKMQVTIATCETNSFPSSVFVFLHFSYISFLHQITFCDAFSFLSKINFPLRHL